MRPRSVALALAVAVAATGCSRSGEVDNQSPPTPMIESARPQFAHAGEVHAAIPEAAREKARPLLGQMSGGVVGLTTFLRHDIELGGIRCRGAAQDVVITRSDFWGCTVAVDTTLDGLTSAAGTWLSVHYGTGTRQEAVFADLVPAVETLALGPASCRDFAHYFPDGTLQACVLAMPLQAAGVNWPAGSRFSWTREGALEQVIVYESLQVGAETRKPGTFRLDPETGELLHAPGWLGQ